MEFSPRAITVMFLPMACLFGQDMPNFPHKDTFDALLQNLREQHWSQEDGWNGDWMHEATGFAPRVLFGWGAESGSADLVQLGSLTVIQEEKRIQAWLTDPSHQGKLARAAAGFPAFLFQFLETQDRTARNRSLLALVGMNLALAAGGDRLDDLGGVDGLGYFPPPALYAITAYGDLAQATGSSPIDDILVVAGRKVLGAARSRYFREELGLYRAEGSYVHGGDWPNGLMLVALCVAYSRSGRDRYLTQAIDLAEAVERELGDPTRGGYFTDLPGKGRRQKYLSGNAVLLWGLLSLYRVTEDRRWAERAERTISFLKTDLFDGSFFLHDWNAKEGASKTYCTGCNFLLLNDLLLYHRIESSLAGSSE